MKPKRLLFIAAAAFAICSCQKEPDDTSILPVDPAPSCKVVKEFVFDETGQVTDSIGYSYSGNLITKIDWYDHLTYAFVYSGTKVSRRNLLLPGTSLPIGYDTIQYNADGLPLKIERILTTTGSPQPVLSYSFIYADNKLVQVNTMEEVAGRGFVLTDEIKFLYTGKDITREIAIEHTELGTINTDTADFKFDSKPNYFGKQNKNLFLADPFIYESGPYVLNAILSEHNLIEIVEDKNSPGMKIDYTEYINGNLNQMKQDGIPALQYFYQCP